MCLPSVSSEMHEALQTLQSSFIQCHPFCASSFTFIHSYWFLTICIHFQPGGLPWSVSHYLQVKSMAKWSVCRAWRALAELQRVAKYFIFIFILKLKFEILPKKCANSNWYILRFRGNGKRGKCKKREREMAQLCFVVQQLNTTQFCHETLKCITFLSQNVQMWYFLSQNFNMGFQFSSYHKLNDHSTVSSWDSVHDLCCLYQGSHKKETWDFVPIPSPKVETPKNIVFCI